MVCCVVVVLSNCLNAERFLLWRIGGLFAARPLHTPYIAWLKATTGVNPAMVFETVVARPRLSCVKLIVAAGSEIEATSPALLKVVVIVRVPRLFAVAEASAKTTQDGWHQNYSQEGGRHEFGSFRVQRQMPRIISSTPI
jgi:hypothetical protein